jgi:transcriptional regulator with XRE-family HTH domain
VPGEGVTTMMTVEEMREARKKLHYTYEMVAEKSGVPLSTVQKVFSGTTDRPHFKTMTALEAVFRRADKSRYDVYTDISGYGVTVVKESGPAYDLFGTGDPKTTDTTDAFGGVYEISEEGLPVHPRYKIPVRKQGDYTTDDLDKIPDEIRV